MRIYHLKNKLVILLQPKAAEFLKATSTNTLDKPRNAFVNLKGKIVVTFEQEKLNEEEVLLVIENQYFDRLNVHLKTTLFLNEVALKPQDYKVTCDLDGDVSIQEEMLAIVISVGAIRESPRLLLTRRQITPNVSDEEYTLYRLHHHIPLQGRD